MTLPIKVADEVVGRAIPENLHAGIEMYINDGIPLGGFLEAVFSNDHFEGRIQRSGDACNRGVDLQLCAERLPRFTRAGCRVVGEKL